MKPAITRDFLFEYFRGKATSIQKQFLDNWIKDPDNEELFYQYLEEWERMHPQYLVETGKGIRHFRESLNKRESSNVSPVTAKKRNVQKSVTAWLPAAAIVVLLSTLGWLYKEPILYTQYLTKPGEVKHYTLPDGSQVTLNANSRLKVSRLWRLFHEREVFLTGEGEFRVTKNESARKFTVRTDNNVDIVVLGTVFTVFNRRQRTEVALNEGKVMLTQQIGNSIQSVDMVAGDKALIEASLPAVIESGIDLSNTSIWKENRFEFDRTSLKEIALLANDRYSLQTFFGDTGIEALSVTGSFVAMSAEEFLESICLMYGLRYEQTNQMVTFYKQD